MYRLIESLETRRLMAVFTVTTTAPSDPGSLRWAILDANASIGPDQIEFAIGDGVQVIRPDALLGVIPVITEALVIDGAAPATFPTQQIQLSGELAGLTADGIRIGASDVSIRRLTISNFADDGIDIAPGTNISINGCNVGTDVTGTLDQGNGNNGVEIAGASVQIGGVNIGEGNLISGNNGNGIRATGGTVKIEGNLIGTAAGGMIALANTNDGVQFVDTVNSTIGGLSASARNIISGNGDDGIEVQGASAVGNAIHGNYIGLDLAGVAPVRNGSDGIEIEGASQTLIGGTTTDARNFISGNFSDGIEINKTTLLLGGNNNQILGNTIGLNINGAAVANFSNGVQAKAGDGNAIGNGTAAGTNTIAGNGLAGVFVLDANGISVRHNAIHDNGGLGIDLAVAAFPGVTLNDIGDADVGANGLQNFPVITSADPGSVKVTLDSTPNSTFIIDLYRGPAADLSGFGEGALSLHSGTLVTDASGFGTVTIPATSLSIGEFVSATATAADGSTSEFSAVFSTTADTTAPSVVGSSFEFDQPTPAAPHQVKLALSENVSPTLTVSDLLLTNLTTSTVVPTAAIALTFDPVTAIGTFTFPGFSSGVLPDGNYRATLPAASVQDLAGNALANSFSFDFFVFAGDANHDRIVNINDFSILASRFNQPGTFSQGDFNYDGVVNISDFSTLASRFNQSLPAARPLAAQSVSRTQPSFSATLIDDILG